MLKFKTITMKNFLSFGNVPQLVNLEEASLSIIVGINNDASTDDETRNGVGKSSLIQAMHFAIFGKSIDNKIKLANLVNKTNKKNCVVCLDFEKNGVHYQIERSRNPTNLIFKVNGKELDSDKAQGENKETQIEIESILGMSQDVFSQIITLTTNTEPFLALSTSKQRVIIDELFTITQLTEKAEKLKEASKATKDLIANEAFRLQTLEQTNEKVHSAIELALKSSNIYEQKQKTTINELLSEYNTLRDFDIDIELGNYKQYSDAILKNKEIENLEIQALDIFNKFQAWSDNFQATKEQYQLNFTNLDSIDIKKEINFHEHNKSVRAQIENNKKIDTEIKMLVVQRSHLEKTQVECQKKINTSKIEIDKTEAHTEHCPLCNSVIDEDKHKELIEIAKNELLQHNNDLDNVIAQINKLNIQISDLVLDKVEVPDLKETIYKTEIEAATHELTRNSAFEKLKEYEKQVNPYSEQLTAITDRFSTLGDKVHVVPSIWKSESDIHLTAQYINTLNVKINEAQSSINPYLAQIEQLTDALQVIDTSELNRLRKLQEHQEFLIKLLTDKNSYVRKIIINQNLAFLNERLKSYIEKSSSLHIVKFENDLSVNITKFGESYDYDNLSRGEKTRIIISLSLAFRDMFESLNFPVNSLMIDEFLDNGLDAVGVKSCYDIINTISNHNKNCFLITHREEIKNKCPTTITITMEGGFSTINQESEA